MATPLRAVPSPPAAAPPPSKNRCCFAAALPANPAPNPAAAASSRLPIHLPRRNGRRRAHLPPPTVPAASGAAGSAATMTSEGFADLLEGVEVSDLEGRSIPILDLWKDRKAVVGFARHFGCVLCRKRADVLASKKDIMDAAGVALVLIGPGSVDQAKAFFEQTKFKGEIYADPGHLSFNALKFVSGVSSTFTPSVSKPFHIYLKKPLFSSCHVFFR
uniref:UPF0308 protein At2g37240, chloroplastic n=1 Tax=Anthurium amnicola TaxID=1678845 RepID=A0A1D1Y6U5_9ARAE